LSKQIFVIFDLPKSVLLVLVKLFIQFQEVILIITFNRFNHFLKGIKPAVNAFIQVSFKSLMKGIVFGL